MAEKRTTEPDCAPVWSGIYRSGTEKKWTNLEVLNYHYGTLAKESIRAQFAAQSTLSCRMMVNNWAWITDAVVSENILSILTILYTLYFKNLTIPIKSPTIPAIPTIPQRRLWLLPDPLRLRSAPTLFCPLSWRTGHFCGTNPSEPLSYPCT